VMVYRKLSIDAVNLWATEIPALAPNCSQPKS